MSLAARYVWAYLPCHADREGRLKDSPFTIKTNIMPADDVDMNAVLAELAERRHIIRYEVDGRKCIQIRSFLRHQSPHTREVESKLPPVPGPSTEQPRLGSASASPSPASVSPSPSIPDPVPGPDLRSSLSPLSSVQAQAGVRSNGGAKIWTAHDWRDRFGRAWAEMYQTLSYGDAGDTRACVALDEVLAPLTDAERIAAQGKAPGMFAEFLANSEPRVVSRRHPFVFFAQEWGGLRVPRQATAPPRQGGGFKSNAEKTQDAAVEWLRLKSAGAEG